MYTLVRRYLKTAVAFLLVGLALGSWMMARRELADVYPSGYLISAHTHALVVGFVMLMIMGVALWLFSRPEKGDERYQTRVAGELLRPQVEAGWLRWGVVLSGFVQIAGLALFFHTMWSRIRPVGSAAREAKRERF